jgi:hypothetical protein
MVCPGRSGCETSAVRNRRPLIARAGISFLDLLAIVAILSSCSHNSSPKSEPTNPTSVKSAGTTLDTPGYKVSVTGAPSEPASAFRVTSNPQTPPKVQPYITSTAAGVSVSLPDGRQPSAPLTLTFDFRGKPAPVLPGQLPAVVALSEGVSEPEILRSHWDPDHQTLTAQSTHLSGFFPFAVNVEALGQQVTQALSGYLGLSSAKPDCVGKPLVVDGTTYTLDPVTVPAAWPCLSRRGSDISVDLASNSPLGWVVRSEPVSRDQGPDLAPDVGQAIDLGFYQTVFAPSVGNGTMLLPGGSTHLRYSKTDPPRVVGLRADPGVTLINGFLLGLHALYPSSKIFDLPGIVDCLKPFAATGGGTMPSGTDIGARTRPLIDCVTSGTDAVPTNPATVGLNLLTNNIATKSLGAVLSLGPDVANQLAASLSGFFGEFTGQNTETLAVLAGQHTTSGGGAESAIDRVDVTTWAYDRVEGDTYKADNTGGKQIEVFWKSFAGAHQVRSGCNSTLRIEGPGANETKERSGCDAYDPGLFVKLPNPGVFTVTVTVRPDGQPPITAHRTVTVLPHG